MIQQRADPKDVEKMNMFKAYLALNCKEPYLGFDTWSLFGCLHACHLLGAIEQAD